MDRPVLIPYISIDTIYHNAVKRAVFLETAANWSRGKIFSRSRLLADKHKPRGHRGIVATEDERRLEIESNLRLEVENVDLRRLLAQAGIDAAELKVVERLQRIVLEELHHRVKNTLANVLAITSQSLRTAESLEHGRQAIEFRLLALGRVHDLLLQANWTSAPLATILKTAIDPFDVRGKGRFFIQSSNIEVSAAAVLPLAMVLNELCTNAVKYGALSNETGRVDITATVDASGDQFRLRWAEKDGPAVSPPTRRSFGSRLIEHSFVKQLQGEARLTFSPSGVVCDLDIPVAALKPSPAI
jgi:two-component sensor histidine kinase